MNYKKYPILFKKTAIIHYSKIILWLKKVKKAYPRGFYAGLLIVLLSVGGAWFKIMPAKHIPEKGLDTKIEVKKDVIRENKYSRISFFFALPVRGSLAVPENWEGKYRVQNGTDTMKISFLSASAGEKELFYIRSYFTPKWEALPEESSEKVLLAYKGQTFVYKMNEENPFSSGPDKERYQAMIAESQEALKSFKPF